VIFVCVQCVRKFEIPFAMADKHPQNAADGKHPAVTPSTPQPAKPIAKPAGKDNPKPQEPVTGRTSYIRLR
jgi:hypothetical protein